MYIYPPTLLASSVLEIPMPPYINISTYQSACQVINISLYQNIIISIYIYQYIYNIPMKPARGPQTMIFGS